MYYTLLEIGVRAHEIHSLIQHCTYITIPYHQIKKKKVMIIQELVYL